MRVTRIFAFALALVFLLGCVPSAFANAEEQEKSVDKYFTIRVKLTSLGGITSLDLTTKGEYMLKESSYNASDSNITISIADNNLQVTVNGSVVYSGKQVTLLRKNILASAGNVTLAANSRKYLGDFYFYLESGKITVVNHLPMAYYLYGVLAAEMNNSYPLEALKAQAVAAKCYAMKRMKPSQNYDIRDQSTDQAYKGYNSSWTNIFNAVDSSIANIVTYNGDLLTTYYSSTNGGETNLPTYQWSGDSSFNNGYALAIDEYDFTNSSSRMEKVTVELGSSDINKELKQMLIDMTKTLLGSAPADVVRIDDIYLHTPKYSNVTRNMTSVTAKYVVKPSAESEETQTLEIHFPVSKLFTYGVFKDSALTVYWGEKIGDKYHIYHVRYGHGVGLSQRGAQARALDGHTFKDILQFYFPTAELSLMDIRVPEAGGNPDIELPKPIPPKTSDAVSGAIKLEGEMEPAKQGKVENPDIAFPGKSPILLPRYEVIERGYITASQVNMRSGPSTKFPVVAKLTKGTQLDILDMSNPSWYYVKYGDLFGYVSSQYIEIIPDENPQPTYTSYKAAKINATGVNFRSEPNTDCTTYCKLDKNTLIYVWDTAGESKDWYFVQYGFTFGYVYNPYVTIIEACDYKPSSDPAIALGKTLFTVDLFSYPAVNSSVLKSLVTDSEVELLAYNNGWYYAMSDGKAGYLVESSVEIISFEPLAPGTALEFNPTPIGTGYINASEVKFRAKPSTSATIISIFPYEAQVTIYSIVDDWYGITYNNTFGYVYSQYVTLTSQQEPQELTGITLPQGKCTANTLNFREYPNTSCNVISKFGKNDTFSIIGECNGWYFILHNGITGYVLSDYVEVIDSGDLSPIKVGEDWQSVVTTTQAAVNFRMGPSVAFSIICKLEANTQVTVLAYFSSEWCMVLYKGAIGFVSRQYLNL